MLADNKMKIHYQDVENILSGSYTALDIFRLSTPYSCTGRKDYIDGELYDGTSAITETAIASLYTMKDFYSETTANQTLANYLKTKTPITNVNDTVRIAVTSKVLEAGYAFKHYEEDILLGGANPESKIGRSIIASWRRKKGSMFINALAATSVRQTKVQKTTDGTDFEDIESDLTIPTDRQISTLNEGFISIDDFSVMQSMTETNMTEGEQWFVLVSPAQKDLMIRNNIDYIMNGDFVVNGSLETGTLPNIMNFTVISHPLMGILYPTKFFAFTKSAIAEANFSGLSLNFGDSVDNRFEKVLYYSQNVDYKCIDFGKIIQGSVTPVTETDSSSSSSGSDSSSSSGG